jgi:hypothetical protein
MRGVAIILCPKKHVLSGHLKQHQLEVLIFLSGRIANQLFFPGKFKNFAELPKYPKFHLRKKQ